MITIVPANEATCDDLRTVFGARGVPAWCQCQWFKIPRSEEGSVPADQRAKQLREQAGCGHPQAGTATSGLIASLDGEPAGWCAVEPRTAYPRLLRARVPWAGRDEDKTDERVWAVTCFVTRAGFRRRGVSRALARAAVDHARKRGARALEGYPLLLQPGERVTWGDLFVGSADVFADAGFVEVSRPTPRRLVMRIDFAADASG